MDEVPSVSKIVKLVIVAESPPASGKYFYDTTGSPKEPLFSALLLQLGISPTTKVAGLIELQKRGWVLVDATYQPVDKLAKDARHDRDAVIANDYPLLVEDLLFLAEARRPDGSLEPIAFMLSLPDYNTAIAPLHGRLLPFGWLKFFLGMKKIRALRVVTLGIKQQYRMRGIQSLMFEEGLRAALERGYTGCEVSWMLEDNDLVIRSVRLWGGRHYKTYRMYDKPLVLGP